MYCDSKHDVNRSSGRSRARVRRAAMHRPDPRRPQPIFASVMSIAHYFASYEKPR